MATEKGRKVYVVEFYTPELTSNHFSASNELFTNRKQVFTNLKKAHDYYLKTAEPLDEAVSNLYYEKIRAYMQKEGRLAQKFTNKNGVLIVGTIERLIVH